MRRALVVVALVIGFCLVAGAAQAAPETPPPPPGGDIANISELPEFTQQDYNCLVTAYGLVASSLSLFITGTNPAGAIVVLIKAITWTGRMITLVTFVNSCLNITKVEEQLFSGLKIRCAAGGWVWVPGARNWQC